MFERYTEKARRVIFFGRYEASQFGSSYIEPEHLLLGILREDKTLVSRLKLAAAGGIADIRKEIERHTTVREKVSTSVDLPLSNEGKRMLAFAAEEADRLSHKHIDVGHLLLGMLREEKCFGAELLRQRGVQLASARDLIRTSVEEPSPQRPIPSTELGFDISELGSSLTQQAADNLLPPLVGRERELERVIQILCRLTRRNAVLVGEPGVGKKTIVYGLAHRIAEGNVPASLENSSFIRLDPSAIAPRLRSRILLEASPQRIVQKLVDGDILLFIDGLHNLAQAPGFLNLADIIKPVIMQGNVQCISTATPAEYQKTIETAPWLEQLFSVVEVRPPSESEAITVLRGVKERFEQFHEVHYSDEAIEYAVFHSSSYFPNRYLPEKAIDLMDDAGARIKLRQRDLPDEVLELRKRLRFIQGRHDNAISNHEFEKARFYSDEARKEQENLKVLAEKYKLGDRSTTIVSRDDIDQIVAERTGISMDTLRKSRAPKAPGDEKAQ